MSIGLPDIKLLWGRAGGLCTICRINLSEEKKTSSEAFPFGEQAHIVAEEDNGPRGKSRLTPEQRNNYPNLILLCPNCHTKIDKAPEEFSIELLHQLKAEHELWFEKSRCSAADKLKRASDYIYADIVDTAAKLCMFDTWEKWTSHAASPSPKWRRDWLDSVENFRTRIVQAVWPGSMAELERALKTLSINLKMAAIVFTEHSELIDKDWFRDDQFYRGNGWNENYDRDLRKYKDWRRRQEHFIFESTKSANWVAEIVRRDLNPGFFAVPGKFIVTVGPQSSGSFETILLEYTEDQKAAEPGAASAKLDAYFNSKGEGKG